MNITIVGTGYVGLTSGVCLASLGHTVRCLDIDTEKIARLSNGICPIYEPGLPALLEETLRHQTISFTTEVVQAAAHGDIILLCVDTPPTSYGKANLSRLLASVAACAPHAKHNTVFVNKSTAPVGTVQKIRTSIKDARKKEDFSVASNPEFLSEGSAVLDFLKPERIVIGVEDERGKERLSQVYESITRQGVPLIVTSIPSAELIKYTANAFLALKISFINEIADFAELVGANIEEVRAGIGSDTRIGQKFFGAGIGYGGSCFGKDVKALAASGEEHGIDFKIIKALATVNDLRYRIILTKLKKHHSQLQGKTIAVLGLAFKPNTADVRDAPAQRIVSELLDCGVSVRAYDVAANDEFKKAFARAGDITFGTDVFDALLGSDAALILTEWEAFKTIDLEKMKVTMRGNLIIDGRNIFDRTTMETHGFIYEGIGR